jgi:hypothetical protein
MGRFAHRCSGAGPVRTPFALHGGRARTRLALLAGAALVSAAVCVGLAAAPALATTFVVNNTLDSGPGSLRQAITDSNAAGGTNIITIVPGLGTPITLASDLPAVQSNVTIVGNNATLSGNNQFRGLLVGAWTPGTATQVAVTVAIQDLTITNTKAQGGAGGNGDIAGGGGAGLGGALFVANLANVSEQRHALEQQRRGRQRRQRRRWQFRRRRRHGR